ncbi:hypothetical protein K8T06_14150, partial [bacterium]|nr:hypothetical protein [bacterium]
TGWLWYDSKIEFTELNIDDQGNRLSSLKLWYGAVAIRTQSVPGIAHKVVFDIDSISVSIGTDSLVRLTMESDLTAIYMSVREANGEAESEGNDISMQAGKTYLTHPGSGRWKEIRNPELDSFDSWFIERDKLLIGAYEHTDQLPEEMVPAEYSDEAAALHGYGRWISISGSWYWSPYVAAGWVPYHNGHWDYYPGWGWTWIPYEPWGWTAFHYGYWSYYFDWGWLWFPSWRWRPHYAHWRYDGRTVHWIAVHPDDPTDRNGLLLEGATPRNSQLQIGIPVEAGQTVEEMLNRNPVRRNAIYSMAPNTGQWKGTISELSNLPARQVGTNHSVTESFHRTNIHNYSAPSVYPRQINRPLGVPYKSPVSRPRPSRKGISEINRQRPSLKKIPKVNQEKNPIINIFKNRGAKKVIKILKPALRDSEKNIGALNSK